MSQTVPWLRRHRFFLIVLLLSAALRVTILLTSQYAVNSDEGVIGIMATRILEFEEFPVFFQAQPYNGGAAIEAYLGALLFSVFGISSIGLKSVILLMSLFMLGLTYFFTLKLFDKKTAIIATVLISVSPTLVKWHFQVRGGYVESLCFVLVITYLFLRIIRDDHATNSTYFLFGFSCGLAYWNSELIFSLFLTCFLFWFAKNKLFFFNKKQLFTAAGGILGLSPVIVYNATHNLRNLRFIFNRIFSPYETLPEFQVSSNIRDFFFMELPRFFGTETIFWYHFEEPISLVAILFFAVFVIVISLTILSNFDSFKSLVKRLFGLRTGLNDKDLNPTIFMFIFVILHLVLMFRPTVRPPGYLLPIVPFFSILTAVVITRYINMCRTPHSLIARGVLLILVVAGVSAQCSIIARAEVESLPIGVDGKMVNFRTDADSIYEVIHFLKSKDIQYVYAPYWIKYRLIFESNEEIIASSSGLWPQSRFPHFETLVEQNKKGYCFVVESQLAQRQALMHLLRERKMAFEEHNIGEFSILIAK